MKKVKIRRTLPSILYPGSLIQQHFGESLYHGFAKWEVDKRDYEFVVVSNDHGYYTLNISNGVLPIKHDMPLKPSIRLRVYNTNHVELKRIINDLKQLYDAKQITFDVVSEENEDADSIVYGLDYLNISDIDIQNKLISDYASKHLLVEEHEIDALLNLNKTFNQHINNTKTYSNLKWIPRRFEFSNMFSYGENNVIDFANIHSLVGVFGKNAIGKSSLFSALCFCLYDKTERTFKSSEIINNKSNNFVCRLTFEIEGETFVIERNGEKLNDGRVPVDVDFKKITKEGIEISLNGEQRRDTNKNIRDYVGEYDDFILTALSLQNNATIFIDKSQSERKDLLAQFIGLDIFDNLYNISSDKLKNVSAIITEYERMNIEEQLQIYEDKLLQEEESLIQKQSVKSDLDSEQNIVLESLMKLNEQLYDVSGVEEIDVELYEERISVSCKLIEEYKSAIEASQLLLSVESETLTKSESLIADIDIQSLMSEYRELKRLHEEHVSLKKDIKNIDNEKSTINNEIENIKSISDFNENCEHCIRRNKKDYERISSLNVLLDKKNKRQQSLSDKLTTITERIGILQDSEKKYDLYTHVKDIISETQKKIFNAESDIRLYTAKIDKLNSDIKLYSEKVSAYNFLISKIEHNNTIKEKLSGVLDQKDRLQKSIKNISAEIENIYRNVSVYKARYVELKEKYGRYSELLHEIKLLNAYVQCIKRDGVPYELIKISLPVLEREVNMILSQMVDFRIILFVDGKNIDVKIAYDENNIWPLELSSGMERFISSIAIRVALSKISNKPTTNFIAIDEGFGNLDADNIASISSLLFFLKNEFDMIFIISHIDSMKDIIVDSIEIELENGFSKIKV